MNISSFKESLSKSQPPQHISVYLSALWYDAKGNWNRSHHLIQDVEDVDAAWIHAYLHRKEGDVLNADYWYKRAGKKRAASSLEEDGKK